MLTFLALAAVVVFLCVAAFKSEAPPRVGHQKTFYAGHDISLATTLPPGGRVSSVTISHNPLAVLLTLDLSHPSLHQRDLIEVTVHLPLAETLKLPATLPPGDEWYTRNFIDTDSSVLLCDGDGTLFFQLRRRRHLQTWPPVVQFAAA
jgi:hypothetical protein